MSNQHPVDRVKDGNISASIFRNTNTKTGEHFYAVSIARNFQDKQTGEWKQTQSYSASDLGKLKNVAEIASYRIDAHQRMTGATPENTNAPQAQDLQGQRDAALSTAPPAQEAPQPSQTQPAPETTQQPSR